MRDLPKARGNRKVWSQMPAIVVALPKRFRGYPGHRARIHLETFRSRGRRLQAIPILNSIRRPNRAAQCFTVSNHIGGIHERPDCPVGEARWMRQASDRHPAIAAQLKHTRRIISIVQLPEVPHHLHR